MSPDGSPVRELPSSVFENRSFMLVWLGQATSLIGDRIHNLVVAWWIMEKTGDAAMVGYVLLAGALPLVVLSPLGGTLADRWDRRRILWISDLVRGIVVLVLAWLDASGGLTIAHLFVATVLINLCAAVFTPALLAAVPTLVRPEQIMRASSMQDSVAAAAGIVGPAAGGMLVAAAGTEPAFAINGASYVVAAATALAARFPARVAAAGSGSGLIAQLTEGLAYLRSARLILGMIVVFGALNFFAAPLGIYLPYFARQVYGRSADALGWMEASLSVGMVVAGIMTSRWATERRKAGPILVSIVASGLMFGALGSRPPYVAALAILFGMGLAIGVANTCILVLFQHMIPNETLGRVMGLVTTVTTAAQPVAYGVCGLLGDPVGIPALAVCSGAGIVVGATYLLVVPGFRDV
jgi:MFS family permease